MNLCIACAKETKNDKYCSRSCAAKVNNSLNPKRVSTKRKDCANCGKETMNQKYCANSCQMEFAFKQEIDKWISGEWSGSTRTGFVSHTVRNWLLKKAEYKCEECGWGEKNPLSGRVPLELDHIDGDHKNNRPENLRILCPNCHALTPTWKALNSNHNREKYQTLEPLNRENAREFRYIKQQQ